MFKVGDQVHIRGGWHSSTFDYTYDIARDRSVETGTVVWVGNGTDAPYAVKFWSKPSESYLCGEKSLVRADVQAG